MPNPHSAIGHNTRANARIHPSRPPGPVAAVKAPADAVVLFDGTSLAKWMQSDSTPAKWPIVDGAFEVVPKTGTLTTRERFGDVHLHIELMAPAPSRNPHTSDAPETPTATGATAPLADTCGRAPRATSPGPSIATADHVKSFWTPGMRASIIAHADAGGDGFDPIVLEAVKLLRASASAV